MLRKITTILVIALVISSCQEAEKEGEAKTLSDLTEEEKKKFAGKGKEAVEDLAGTLGSQLKLAMANGGPVEAVKVCKNVAQPLTESVSAKREGIAIGRTSLKVRNPKNKPDETDRKILESWQSSKDEGQGIPDFEVVRLDQETVRFYKPIVLQEVCLNCHGSNEKLKPELKTLLDECYPADQARDYQVGDLSGVFRVDMDRDLID